MFLNYFYTKLLLLYLNKNIIKIYAVFGSEKIYISGTLINTFTYDILVNPERNPIIYMLLFNKPSLFLMDE